MLKISIDGIEYATNYENDSRTKQAGEGYITFLLIGYTFMIILFIPLLLDYIPLCCNCSDFVKCLNHIKKSKVVTLRAGVICMGITWIIASVDWISTEHCCNNWYKDIAMDTNNNIYSGADCDWYLSIYALLLAGCMSLVIAIYSFWCWDVKYFKAFRDEEYFRMV